MRIMQAQHRPEELLNPGSAAWQKQPVETIALKAVPLAAQPNNYIRRSWQGRDYGNLGEVGAALQQHGEQVYVRLEWKDDPQAEGEFPDAAAILLGRGQSITTLGSKDQPLKMWYWADGRSGALNLTATGPGVFARADGAQLGAAAITDQGRWQLVVCGPRAALQGNQLGVVVWNGSNDERAGLAAVSGWLELGGE